MIRRHDSQGKPRSIPRAAPSEFRGQNVHRTFPNGQVNRVVMSSSDAGQLLLQRRGNGHSVATGILRYVKRAIARGVKRALARRVLGTTCDTNTNSDSAHTLDA